MVRVSLGICIVPNSFRAFREVLIVLDYDDSEESSDLRAAHSQRVISVAVYDDVWKPLRSELTFQKPRFSQVPC